MRGSRRSRSVSTWTSRIAPATWAAPKCKRWSSRAIRETTGADLAYMNRGGVRDSLSRGTIRARHVWNILPFDNELVEAEVRGRDLPQEFAQGRDVDPNRTYRFVTNDYVSGQWQRLGIDFRPTGQVLRETFLDWVTSKERLP